MNPETLQQLSSLVASTEVLKRAGYVVEALTDDDLEQKKRCLKCGVRGKTRAIRKSNSPAQN
jgi:RNA exonuclease 1